MKKSKKFELLLQFVQTLELKPQEVVELFKAKEKGFIANKTLFEPGMFYYANQTFSKELIAGQIVSGIVGFVEKSRALVVGLDERKMSFEEFREEAIRWCYEYNKNGVQRGEAFLPSLQNWDFLLSQKEAINRALKVLSVPLLDGCYWSSTEVQRNSDRAWAIRVGDGKHLDCLKRDEFSVRPVFWV